MARLLKWTEKDFENWFCGPGSLPGGERVLVIARQKPLRRVIDLVALDSSGGLVILEVKNEAATREAVGQSLEYLAGYAHITVEDLEEDYRGWRGAGASLHADFRAKFGHDLAELAPNRRVFLVAPRFHPASALAADYLCKLFAPGQVSYTLVTARRTARLRFELSIYQPDIRPPSQLAGFVTGARDRLFYALEQGPTPILWYVGRMLPTGEVRRRASNQLTRRALRVARGPMVFLAQRQAGVNLQLTGTTWALRRKPSVQARVIGAVTSNRSELIVFARFENGAWKTFRQLTASKFFARYERCEADLPGWKSVLAYIQAREH